MNLNPVKLLKLKSDMESFAKNHPKFASFVKKVIDEGVAEGDVVEIKIIEKDKNIETNIKLKKDDLELLRTLKDLM